MVRCVCSVMWGVWCHSPGSLRSEGGSGGRVCDVPKEGVSPFCWTGLCASSAALSGVALVGCACAWFGANLADSDSEETELLEVSAVHSEWLAGVTASEVAEEAWDCVKGLGCWAPVATSNLPPVEGVIVVGSGGLGPGSSPGSCCGLLGRGCCEGWWWIVPRCEGSGWSAGLDVLGKAHVDVLRLVVGVACECGVSAAGVARSSCARVSRRADVEVTRWGCWPGVWGLS